jgi:hypothetical protein
MRNGFALVSIAGMSALLIAAAPTAPSLEGDWKGSGTVSNNVAADHAECRVRYTRSGDRSFSYTATCTAKSGKYDITGSVTNTSGSNYSGTVMGGGKESGTGHVFLVQHGKHLSVIATNQRGAARLTLVKLGGGI